MKLAPRWENIRCFRRLPISDEVKEKLNSLVGILPPVKSGEILVNCLAKRVTNVGGELFYYS